MRFPPDLPVLEFLPQHRFLPGYLVAAMARIPLQIADSILFFRKHSYFEKQILKLQPENLILRIDAEESSFLFTGENPMNDIMQNVLDAKTNDQRMSDLVNGHKDWILRCAGRMVHRFVSDSDEEWSTALLAFSEAVQKYEIEKGDFHAFAALIIRRRLTDHLRSLYRREPELSVSPGAFDGEVTGNSSEADPVNLHVQKRIAEESIASEGVQIAQEDSASMARAEIAAMQTLLGQYGFSFFDLADCSPKAAKTRASCAQATRVLLSDAALLESMQRRKKLPVRELQKRSGVSRKILDRHRRYIIAAAEILSGNYPVLSSYMDFIRKEGNK